MNPVNLATCQRPAVRSRLDVDADLPSGLPDRGRHAGGLMADRAPVDRGGVWGRLRDEVAGLLVAGPVVVPGWWAIWKVCDTLWSRVQS